MKRIILCMLVLSCSSMSFSADKAKADECKERIKKEYVDEIQNGTFKKVIPADQRYVPIGLFMEKARFPLVGADVERHTYIKNVALSLNNEYLEKYRKQSPANQAFLHLVRFKEAASEDVDTRLNKVIASESDLNDFKLLLHWQCCMKNVFDVLEQEKEAAEAKAKSN